MKPLNYGMVGGGSGAFIGDVHRKAIRIDGLATLCAGCFSRDAEKSKAFGAELGVAPDRLYTNYLEMAEQEAKREDGISFVVCVTPNISHYEVCKAFLMNGINVVCDKPLTWTIEQSQELVTICKEKDLLFGITYTYSGYPAVKQMRQMVSDGVLGKIKFVNGEYPQGWLGTPVDETSKLAPWRMDPKVAGISNCLGDIGSHIENLVANITGLKIERVCARLDRIVEGRTLDDNASVMVEFKGGAKGLYWSSQIAFGNDNGLRVRIYGEKGGLEWFQEDPDHFLYTPSDGPQQRWSRGRDAFCESAQSYSRIPAGHPEGLFEAFANIYKAYIRALAKKLSGENLVPSDLDFPSIEMGLDGVVFINKCVESSNQGASWVTLG
ncbi:putative dehydrogenase [Sphaerochaeta pleomorpha str. Grapes]|uniref:Putative dehydrogenase n=1 Tax=Sphaerochaeta pleomorpha (strain ATCC BAA-1885 / DSM 22778 / Grapes) TaxID=158190 RepID=G8QRQ4_SPHPG|nr:Gfo/Idh/MocA family oxidoreductase [Sphaerochaeta pleomorpha]AEV28837.1 putative dehydrogenase [Sphaerochaeta pleomorpha str. Grapes]